MVCKEIRSTTESKRKYPLNFAAILDEEEIDLYGTFGADTGRIMVTGGGVQICIRTHYTWFLFCKWESILTRLNEHVD